MEGVIKKMIEQRIKQIVNDNVGIPEHLQGYGMDLKLTDIGINSISFVKIMVAIETEFNFEVGDEDLYYSKFPNIDAIVSYVKNKIS